MMRAPIAILLASLMMATFAHAVQPDEVMRDPALEARARALSAELRCMVCQNQSIDDSDAPLARDIRLLIRERIGKGESNEEVRSFLVSRYGDFILLKPPLKVETLLLWGGVPIALAAGAFALWLTARRRQGTSEPVLSDAEEAQLAAIAGATDPARSDSR